MVDAFVQLNRFGRLVIEFDGGPDRFRIERDNAGLWLVDARAHPNDFHELTESTFARMICGPRQYGVTNLARAVEVTHAAPPYAAEYERVFGAPVAFESARNAILVDEKWMFHKLATQPRYVFGILSEHAEALLRELTSSKSVRGRVEGLLMPILHKGDAGMDAVAASMGLSRQTLFRKLKAEGTSFEKVLDGLRHRLAVHYLRGKKVSVNETERARARSGSAPSPRRFSDISARFSARNAAQFLRIFQEARISRVGPPVPIRIWVRRVIIVWWVSLGAFPLWEVRRSSR
jgi:AraC-like DNA-binding protein